MNIKKHYKFLDLDYKATEEQVLQREKVMIKMIRSQTNKKRDEKMIAKVANSANAVIEFIRGGGVVEDDSFVFENSIKNVFGQIMLMAFILVIAVISFVMLLP